MPTIELNKLVRVKLPEIYQAEGQDPEVEIVIGQELREALVAKIHEEIAEFEELYGEGKEGRLAELADIVQALEDLETVTPEGIEEGRLDALRQRPDSLMLQAGCDYDDIVSIKTTKAEQKGRFIAQDEETRVWFGRRVVRLTLAEDDPWVTYYSRREGNQS